MEEQAPQDVDGLLAELQEDYGSDENVPPEVDALLRQLQAERHKARREAATLLGKLEVSGRRVVEALLEVAALDPTAGARRAAVQALHAPAQQRVLEKHPDLARRARSLSIQTDGEPAVAEPAELRKRVPPGLDETETGQSVLAYRLAAILMFITALISIVDRILAVVWDVSSELGPVRNAPYASSAIDVGLAIGLLREIRTARTLILIRSGLGAIVWPIILFSSFEPLAALLMSVMQWGYCGAIVLLLTGRSKTWRLVLATSAFAVLTVGLFAVGVARARLNTAVGPLPDLSDVVLTAEDLPGFSELEPELVGLEAGQALAEDAAVESVFAYMRDAPFESIWGLTGLLPTRRDQRVFDRELSRHDVFLEEASDELGSGTGGEVQEARLTEVDVGDSSIGLTMAFEMGGADLRMDICAFRRGASAAFVYSMYEDGQMPSVPVDRAARLLDQRMIEALAEASGG